MTPQEALDGFKRLQAKYPGTRYKGADLNEVWPQLLTCSNEAFERAVGILLKNSRFLPRAEYVLERTKTWEEQLQSHRQRAPQSVEDGDEGKEALRVLRAEIEGTISRAEAVAAMYRMSQRFGKMEYAAQARLWEKTLNQEATHDQRPGADV